MIRSMVAAIGLVISLLGMALFVAVGIYIWQVKAEAIQQTDTLVSRANETLGDADHAIGYVQEIISKAKQDLADTQKARANSPPQQSYPRQAVNPFIQLTAENAEKQLAGSVGRAHGAVVLASEAVTVADAALNVFGQDSQLKKMLGVKTEQLDATRTALGTVNSNLERARDVLGVSLNSRSAITNEQLQAVDDALNQAQNFVDQLVNAVQNARDRVNEAYHTVHHWALRIAVCTSLLAIFGLVGQLFMARFFWRILLRKPA